MASSGEAAPAGTEGRAAGERSREDRFQTDGVDPSSPSPASRVWPYRAAAAAVSNPVMTTTRAAHSTAATTSP